jgi:hypothetical protein
MAGVKIGNVAEGAFVLALGLIIADNDLQTEQDLKPTRSNIKRLMKTIDPELFVNGGVWNNKGRPIYQGKATLKSKVAGQKILDKKTKQYVSASQIPPDTLQVNLTIQLNRGEVEPFYGPNTQVNHKDWPTMDGIIDQMLNEGNRYRSVIDRVKTKYLTNLREESIIVDIKAMGAEGAYSGGSVKGDVTIETKIIPVSKTGQKTSARPFRLPKMSYSLKASSTPPSTISNQGPIKTLQAFETKFGLPPIALSQDNKINPLLSSVKTGVFKYIQESKSADYNFPQLPVKKQGKGSFLVLEKGKSELLVDISGKRKYELLDGTKFPDLHPAKGTRNSWIRSWVINDYYETFLSVFANLFPSGKLDDSRAKQAWDILIDSAFGSDKAEIISFGKNITKMSTLPYINKLRTSVNDELWVVRSGNNLEFHLPTENGSGFTESTKLYFIRYKNRTPGTDEGVKEFRTAGSVELKMMVESGKLCYEPKGYESSSQIQWNRKTKKVEFLQKQ